MDELLQHHNVEHLLRGMIGGRRNQSLDPILKKGEGLDEDTRREEAVREQPVHTLLVQVRSKVMSLSAASLIMVEKGSHLQITGSKIESLGTSIGMFFRAKHFGLPRLEEH
jgi:hypothetical protein